MGVFDEVAAGGVGARNCFQEFDSGEEVVPSSLLIKLSAIVRFLVGAAGCRKWTAHSPGNRKSPDRGVKSSSTTRHGAPKAVER